MLVTGCNFNELFQPQARQGETELWSKWTGDRAGEKRVWRAERTVHPAPGKMTRDFTDLFCQEGRDRIDLKRALLTAGTSGFSTELSGRGVLGAESSGGLMQVQGHASEGRSLLAPCMRGSESSVRTASKCLFCQTDAFYHSEVGCRSFFLGDFWTCPHS